MDSDSLSYKTLRNVSYSLVGFGLPIVFSVFITPVVVHRLGIVDYGVYILTLTIGVFIGLFDLGLTTAAGKYLSEYFATNNQAELQKLIQALGILYIIIGDILLLL